MLVVVLLLACDSFIFICYLQAPMEAATRKRLWQKAKNIYYSLRSLLCFFVSVDSDSVESGPSTSNGSTKPSPLQPAVKLTSESYFPFEALPEVCQLHVFSYLTVLERGRASAVCRHWNSLLQSATLWTNVDLTVFPLRCSCSCRRSADPCT